MTLEDFLERQTRLSLFLDFDGVLVEIAPRPDAVVLTSEMRDRLSRVQAALGGAVAVISGRSLATIDAHLSPLRLPVAGDHGNERRKASGEILWLNEGAVSASELLYAQLRARLGEDQRLILEKKPSAVALHFRLAPEFQDSCERLMRDVTGDGQDWTLVFGKMVIEARARGVNKGEAVRHFLQEEPFLGGIPIFVGDDRTDEDGFAVVQELGGAGIKIGPGETIAHFRLPDINAVSALLDDIARRGEEMA